MQHTPAGPHGPASHMELHRIVDETLSFMCKLIDDSRLLAHDPEKLGLAIAIDSPDDFAWAFDVKHQDRLFRGIIDAISQNADDTGMIIVVPISPSIQDGGFQL